MMPGFYLRQAYLAWLRFWFFLPAPRAQLALLRIATALVLLYVLFVRSFDLEAQFSRVLWSNPEALAAVDPVAWPFSVFFWGESGGWLWSMHVLAMVLATAFLCGVLTPLTALLSLLFQLSYAHYNPVMLLGVDGLLIVALAYLSLAPSGGMLGVFARFQAAPAPQAPLPPHLAHLQEERAADAPPPLPWSALPVRLLQLHLCLIYLQSALAKLSGDWLAGVALWHPRLVALGVPYPLAQLQAEPYLTSIITYGLLLFELLYVVLIWIRPLRYPMLLVAVVVHLAVGATWSLMPHNLMMLALNIAFIPAAHLESAMRVVRPLLVLPWVANGRE